MMPLHFSFFFCLFVCLFVFWHRIVASFPHQVVTSFVLKGSQVKLISAYHLFADHLAASGEFSSFSEHLATHLFNKN